MKISRQKRLRRYLNFYKYNYHFRSPFQLLIDATFCQEALKSKVNLREQLPKYLDDLEVKLFTTACVITEAEALGRDVFGAMLIVKQFKAQKCGHEKEPISAAECLYSMVQNGNLNHYFIATQDPELSKKCRELLGVPLLYLRYNAINLEKPSRMNTEAIDVKIQENLKGPGYQTEIIKKLKAEAFGEESIPHKKRKKVKGPNPLSCKKKKMKIAEPVQKKSNRKRHKRLKNKAVVIE